jgi:hypothetical protein
VALRAVADDGDLLGLDEGEVSVCVVVSLCHALSVPFLPGDARGCIWAQTVWNHMVAGGKLCQIYDSKSVTAKILGTRGLAARYGCRFPVPLFFYSLILRCGMKLNCHLFAWGKGAWLLRILDFE